MSLAPLADLPFIGSPLPDLVAWTAFLQDSSRTPIMASTALELEAMRVDEDRVDANGLGQVIARDPLMTLKVMAHAATPHGNRPVTDMETVTANLVMMGIPPFFRAFGPQPTIEERLADHPEALRGLQRGLRQAQRASSFALAFAMHRMDRDAPIIHASTLLHDFAELLLWCRAPELALKIRERGRQDPARPLGDVQRQTLNIALPDLQQSLMKAWRLPALLVRISDERQVARANVRCVLLAVRLARHSADGWENPALRDDYTDIGQLLNLAPEAVAEEMQAL